MRVTTSWHRSTRTRNETEPCIAWQRCSLGLCSKSWAESPWDSVVHVLGGVLECNLSPIVGGNSKKMVWGRVTSTWDFCVASASVAFLLEDEVGCHPCFPRAVPLHAVDARYAWTNLWTNSLSNLERPPKPHSEPQHPSIEAPTRARKCVANCSFVSVNISHSISSCVCPLSWSLCGRAKVSDSVS